MLMIKNKGLPTTRFNLRFLILAGFWFAGLWQSWETVDSTGMAFLERFQFNSALNFTWNTDIVLELTWNTDVR